MKQIKIKKPGLIHFSIISLSIIASVLMVKLLEVPYIFIGLVWIFTLLFISLTSKNNSIKILGINICAVIAALTFYEAYLSVKTHELYFSRRITQERYINNKFLGYAPEKNDRMTAAKYYKDKSVFNAAYSIDENGLRISPPYKSSTSCCILFFGDSFTFGVGVNDSETMPYQVGIKTQGKYRIYNFAFGGYGPHQMLSQLEHNIVKNIADCNDTVYGIYQTIPDHIDRAAGLSFWDYHGPRYVLGKDGEAEFAGNFDDMKILPGVILKYLNKSIIYRDVIGNRRFSDREKDLELFIGIVCTAKKYFNKLYPDGKFHVIFWDNRFASDEKQYKISEWMKVLDSLKSKGINIHPVSNILPEYKDNPSKYNLSPYDTHPNPLAYRFIAEYVINNILQK